MFFIIELNDRWEKNNLMNWKDEGKKDIYLVLIQIDRRSKRAMSNDYLPNKNRNSLWNNTSCQLAFCSVVESVVWCGFQSKAKIEPRYSTAKSNVSYKENPAIADFPFLTPRSASFKIYFLCKLKFTWCPFKTGEKAFDLKSYRIPNLQFYLFAVDSNHSSSKFNTWK